MKIVCHFRLERRAKEPSNIDVGTMFGSDEGKATMRVVRLGTQSVLVKRKVC